MAPDELSKLLYGAVTWMLISVVQTIWSSEDPGRETASQRDARMLRSFRFWADLCATLALAAIFIYWCRALTGASFLASRPTAAIVFWSCVLVGVAFVLQYVWWDVIRRAGRARALMVLTPLFVVAFVVPATIEYRNYQKTMSLRRAAVADWDLADQVRRSNWLADIRTAGLLARPGLTPPMLRVEDLGKTVVVHNLADSPLCVSVSRTSVAGEPCGWETANGTACTELGTESSQEFLWNGEGPFKACGRSPLDIRVGDVGHDEVMWWSDESLEREEKQALAEHLERQAFVDGGDQPESIRALSLDAIEARARELREISGSDTRVVRWKQMAAAWRAREQLQLWEALRTPADSGRTRDLQVTEAESLHARIVLLREQGATAPPGTVPAMLEVRDQFSLLRVRSLGEEPLVIRITRLGSHLSQGQAFVCFGHAASDTPRELYVAMNPDQSRTFLIANFEACEPAGKSRLEYEIRDRHGELIWASSSVLDRLEQLATERQAPSREPG